MMILILFLNLLTFAKTDQCESLHCKRLRLQNLALENQGSSPEMSVLANEILPEIATASTNESYCSQPGLEISDILQLAQVSKSTNKCMPLNPGDWKVVDTKGPTGLDANYALTQTSDKKWDVFVAIKSDPQLISRMKECLNIVSPYLKGPDGKELKIHILDPNERQKLPSAKRPPLNEVEIQPAGARSNSRAYAADVGCPTITHEVLHLLGLCDEYDGKDDGWGCRSVPSVPSIMKTHTEVFNKTIPRSLTCKCEKDECIKISKMSEDHVRMRSSTWSIEPIDYFFRNKYCQGSKGGTIEAFNPETRNKIKISANNEFKITTYDIYENDSTKMFPITTDCKCPPEDQFCLEQMNIAVQRIPNNSPQACPYGSKAIHTKYGNVSDSRYAGDPFVISVKAEPDTSILLPSHFNRITGGACPLITPNLNECSQWAYEGAKTNNDCSKKPEICNSDNWWK